MSKFGSNVKTTLSLNMDANEQGKNDVTLRYAADKHNGDNFDVAVDTKTSISRDFDEVNKIPKKKVRNT